MPELMQAPRVTEPDARGQLLARVFLALDRAQIPWCVLHGYQSYPGSVPADVDLLVSASMLPHGLWTVLRDLADELRADPILWLADGAQYIVLAGRDTSPPVLLQLHVSGRYSLEGLVFYDDSEILNSRIRRDDFWTPAPGIEFACIACNRVFKQQFRPEHERQLAALVEEDPSGCERELSRFFPTADAGRLLNAAQSGQWAAVRAALPELRAKLVRSRQLRHVGGHGHALLRRVRRWLRPSCGLHVVLLGPDGVGKSTVIEQVRQHLSPAFLRYQYLTFAPGLLPAQLETPKPDGPHSLPPRSLIGSLIKATWWGVCYTAGYVLTVHPIRARAGLVINHRYLPDAIVDPRRYRYSGPIWLLRALWRVAPKPDLLFLLDAPADVIQARKREVEPQETRRQRDAYLAITRGCLFAHVIDASQPLEQVVSDVEAIVLDYLARRTSRQRGGG